MTYTFRTLLIPSAQQALAALICDEVGYPDKGMFVQNIDQWGTYQGYASSGPVDDTSPFLANDSQDMLDAIQARNPDATVTLQNCAEIIEWLDTTVDEPLGRIAFIQSEMNGVPIAAAWKKPTVSEPGYAKDALVQRASVIWRNLVEGNKEVPAVGRNGWRRVWPP